MLAAYINNLVFWIKQVYYSLVFIHCGSSESYACARSLENLLEAIHSYEYDSEFASAEWCHSSIYGIDVTKW